ncbi:MAG TPA: hypothetical protein VFK02_00165 [Kofleriaceae bacterium]|nr:hypothetical protein [Kofleriaceae bacterium]
MDDRMDIDALLIGALYGELSPAEEARLSAHLESHPADRTALADLTRTRETLRESRILSVQHEPPQSISARLLQEAARRAPRARTQETSHGGWLQRFLRSLMAHPAMAAATMLVLVIGVAGLFRLRGREWYAEQALPESGRVASAPAEVPVTASSPTTVSAADEGNAQPAGSAPAGGAGSSSGSTAGPEGYRVGLDEAERRAGAEKIAKLEEQRGDLATAPTMARDQGQGSKDLARNAAPSSAPAAAPPAPPTAVAKSRSRGIEVRSPEPQPKDLDDAPATRSPAGRVAGDRERAPAVASTTPDGPRGPRDGTSAATGAGAAAAPGVVGGAPPAAAPAAAPEPSPPAVAQATPPSGATASAKGKFAQPAKPAPRPITAQAPPMQPSPPPPPASEAPKATRERLADKNVPADAKADARPEEKSSEDRALVGWAQRQREQVIAYVRSNNCRAAASTATEIYNRAPDYYAANITTDRAVKPCLAYLNSDREREDRSRASERSREERSKAAKRAAPAADTAAPEPSTRK